MIENVKNFGQDAVIIDGKESIKDLKALLKDKEDLELYELKGQKVYTRKGKDIGIVKDTLINQESGDIECVEVSDGVISDVINGRKIVPLIGKVEFAKDIILVEDEAFEELKTTGKGINNYLKR